MIAGSCGQFKSLCAHTQDLAYAVQHPSKLVTSEIRASGQDFMEFELTGRRETTLLIDSRNARHLSSSLQL